MICLNPKARRSVTIDGATFTVRPLLWSERLEISALESRSAQALHTLRLGVVDAVGLIVDGAPVAFDPAILESGAALDLIVAINEMSSVSETDRKNSPSPSAQNPAAGSEPSSWTTSESTANGATSFTPSPMP